MSCVEGGHDSAVTSAGGWDGESLVGPFAFRPLTQQDAERIARWRYPEPYRSTTGSPNQTTSPSF